MRCRTVPLFVGGYPRGQHGPDPSGRGERGNPIVLASSLRSDLDERALNFGCRNLIERNPDLVRAVEVSSDRFFADIDSPAELAIHAGR